MSCKCQNCEKHFKVDLLIPNKLWEKIKPVSKPCGGGLLCGKCIMDKIENMGDYNSFEIIEI